MEIKPLKELTEEEKILLQQIAGIHSDIIDSIYFLRSKGWEAITIFQYPAEEMWHCAVENHLIATPKKGFETEGKTPLEALLKARIRVLTDDSLAT